MRIAMCQCGPAGSINVQGHDYGRTFGRGATVDLDAPVRPGSMLTWEQALGKHVTLFVLVDQPAISTGNYATADGGPAPEDFHAPLIDPADIASSAGTISKIEPTGKPGKGK